MLMREKLRTCKDIYLNGIFKLGRYTQEATSKSEKYVRTGKELSPIIRNRQIGIELKEVKSEDILTPLTAIWGMRSRKENRRQTVEMNLPGLSWKIWKN